jgi:hypothetical protein
MEVLKLSRVASAADYSSEATWVEACQGFGCEVSPGLCDHPHRKIFR